MLVYLLYDYGEYGPEHLQATLDKGKLPEMVRNYTESWQKPEKVNATVDAYMYEMYKIDLDNPSDSAEGPDQLDQGWGGLTLEIVELK